MRRPLHADEGGSGYTSGDPSKTRWANWATAYVKYCDGGSMTGTKEDSTPQRNGSSGPLWCKCCRRLELLRAFLTSSSNPCTDRGKYNLDAQLEHMVAAHSLKTFDRIILSGCSAGGMVRSNSAGLPSARTDQRLLCREDLIVLNARRFGLLRRRATSTATTCTTSSPRSTSSASATPASPWTSRP